MRRDAAAAAAAGCWMGGIRGGGPLHFFVSPVRQGPIHAAAVDRSLLSLPRHLPQ